jgi:recombination protein U
LKEAKKKTKKIKDVKDDEVKKKKRNEGKQFESDFISSFPTDMWTYRLRDTSSSWQDKGNDTKTSRFTVTNICDFLIHNYFNAETYLLELKSVTNKSVPFGNLRKHQVDELYKSLTKRGIKAFFLLNYRSVNETYAITADLIYDYYYNSERKSFSIDWCRENGFLITQRLKKVNYVYDITQFLKRRDSK